MAGLSSEAFNNDQKESLLDEEKEHKIQCCFADNMLRRLLKAEQNENIILSPYSILCALTICMNGARNNTLKQMNDVLYPSQVASDVFVQHIISTTHSFIVSIFTSYLVICHIGKCKKTLRGYL